MDPIKLYLIAYSVILKATKFIYMLIILLPPSVNKSPIKNNGVEFGVITTSHFMLIINATEKYTLFFFFFFFLFTISFT